MTIPSYTVEEMKDHRRQKNAGRLRVFVDSTRPQLEANGYTVRQMTDYHFRVNEALDIFPTHRRYHLLPAKNRPEKRGGYGHSSTLAICRKLLG